jgi:hypothetical protein
MVAYLVQTFSCAGEPVVVLVTNPTSCPTAMAYGVVNVVSVRVFVQVMVLPPNMLVHTSGFPTQSCTSTTTDSVVFKDGILQATEVIGKDCPYCMV